MVGLNALQTPAPKRFQKKKDLFPTMYSRFFIARLFDDCSTFLRLFFGKNIFFPKDVRT
jgi:hypothetical protein